LQLLEVAFVYYRPIIFYPKSDIFIASLGIYLYQQLQNYTFENFCGPYMNNLERIFSKFTQDGSGQKSLQSKSGLLNLTKNKNQETVKKVDNVASLIARNSQTFQGYFQINPSQTKTNPFYDERFSSHDQDPKTRNITDTSMSKSKSFNVQKSHVDLLNARSFRINNPDVDFKEIKEYFLARSDIITNTIATSREPQTSRFGPQFDNSLGKTYTIPNKRKKSYKRANFFEK
jgi:hypothetical protein